MGPWDDWESLGILWGYFHHDRHYFDECSVSSSIRLASSISFLIKSLIWSPPCHIRSPLAGEQFLHQAAFLFLQKQSLTLEQLDFFL